MRRVIVKEIVCKKCGQPLSGSKIIVAYTDEVLGPRMVVECSKCGYLNRFDLERGEKGGKTYF